MGEMFGMHPPPCPISPNQPFSRTRVVAFTFHALLCESAYCLCGYLNT